MPIPQNKTKQETTQNANTQESAPTGMPYELGSADQAIQDALYGQYQAFRRIEESYIEQAQELKDFMRQRMYEMFSGRQVIGQALTEAREMLDQHPTRPKPQKATMDLTPLSLKPWKQENSQHHSKQLLEA
jgi:hypothetical protein